MLSLSRESHVWQSVQRIFKIWEERRVYPSAFIAKLNNLLNPPTQDKEVKVAADFTVSFLFSLKYFYKNVIFYL